MQQPTDQSVGQRKDVPRYWLQSNIRYIALQWPLIHPRKVLHMVVLAVHPSHL